MAIHKSLGLNIVLYTSRFAPAIGGVERYMQLLAEGLADAPEIRQLTLVTETQAGDFIDKLLPFRVVRQPPRSDLWRLIAAADLLHLAGPAFVPLLFGLLLRKPVTIEQHGYQACCPNGLLLYEPAKAACPGHFMAQRYHWCLRCNAKTVGWRRSLQMLLLTFPRRWMCHIATVNLPITHHVANRLQIPRSQVIYYGINDPLVVGANGADLHQRPNLTSEPLCFAYLGRLTSEKGLPLLIRAAAVLRRRGYTFRVMFIGDGPERPALEQLATELELQDQVTFTGFLTGEALDQALTAVAVVVMPSIWEETAGLAAMEQMIRGRLVIASDIGGLGEVVDDAGIKFIMGDIIGLADAMQRVLDDPGLIRSFGQVARQRALQQFRHDRMIHEHLTLYTELIELRTK